MQTSWKSNLKKKIFEKKIINEFYLTGSDVKNALEFINCKNFLAFLITQRCFKEHYQKITL